MFLTLHQNILYWVYSYGSRAYQLQQFAISTHYRTKPLKFVGLKTHILLLFHFIAFLSIKLINAYAHLSLDSRAKSWNTCKHGIIPKTTSSRKPSQLHQF